jgi:hypothetical protein
MRHSDIAPEHECSGELIDVSDTKYATKTWCSKYGTEFSYEPDSTWVTIVLQGMRTDPSI